MAAKRSSHRILIVDDEAESSIMRVIRQRMEDEAGERSWCSPTPSPAP